MIPFAWCVQPSVRKATMRFTIGRTGLGAVVALGVLTLAPPLAAQQGEVTGRVTDKASGQVVAGAGRYVGEPIAPVLSRQRPDRHPHHRDLGADGTGRAL